MMFSKILVPFDWWLIMSPSQGSDWTTILNAYLDSGKICCRNVKLHMLIMERQKHNTTVPLFPSAQHAQQESAESVRALWWGGGPDNDRTGQMRSCAREPKPNDLQLFHGFAPKAKLVAQGFCCEFSRQSSSWTIGYLVIYSVETWPNRSMFGPNDPKSHGTKGKLMRSCARELEPTIYKDFHIFATRVTFVSQGFFCEFSRRSCDIKLRGQFDIWWNIRPKPGQIGQCSVPKINNMVPNLIEVSVKRKLQRIANHVQETKISVSLSFRTFHVSECFWPIHPHTCMFCILSQDWHVWHLVR